MTFRADVVARLSIISAFAGVDGPRVFSPPVPEETLFPYAVVAVDVNDVPGLTGGGGRVVALRRNALFVVWEQEDQEDEALMLTITAAVGGYRPAGGMRWRIDSIVRLRDPQLPFVQHQFRISTATVTG
jgi:hypothetical protein